MYRVSKILNNNGVIAINTEDNQEYVLLGKGIGFGKKVSQRFEVTEDTATYRLTEQTDRGSAKSLVQEMDPEFLEIADEVIREAEKVFGKVRYAKETAERKNHLQALQAERDKAEKDLLALKTEILAVIKGESAFPKDTLAEMIAAQEKKHTELVSLCEEASAELDKNAELMANVSQLYVFSNSPMVKNSQKPYIAACFFSFS